MSKKGLFMIAVVLGPTVALLALAPAIAASGGATRAEVADDFAHFKRPGNRSGGGVCPKGCG